MRESMARWLALGGIVGPLLFTVVVVIAALLRPGYDHISSFISALGADGTPRAALMNFGAFIPAGLLLMDFGAGLMLGLPDDRVVKVASVLAMMFGLGIAASGFISCDAGCPNDGSLENTVHNAIAPVSFIGMIAAIAMLGVRFRRWPEWRGLSVYSVITSVLAFAFLAALVSTLESRVRTGLWQRLMLAALFTWCVVVGTRLFRARRPAAWS